MVCIMTKKDVKKMFEGFHFGKVVDIDIYFNGYTQFEQATVIVIENHMVKQYLVDDSGFISCTYPGFDGFSIYTNIFAIVVIDKFLSSIRSQKFKKVNKFDFIFNL